MLSKRHMMVGLAVIVVLTIVIVYVMYKRKNPKFMMVQKPSMSGDGAIFYIAKFKGMGDRNNADMMGRKVTIHSQALGKVTSTITGWYPGGNNDAVIGIQIRPESIPWDDSKPVPEYAAAKDYIVISM